MVARMTLRSASLSLLALVVVALRKSCFGASSHSLKYFSTSISDPSQEQPHFVSVGYMDGQLFVHYDSHSRRGQPRISWMEKIRKENPQYWERETQREHVREEVLKEDLEGVRTLYNQSKEGLHTWQVMYSCELQADGNKGFLQYGYDGRTFITFDKETLTWVAPSPQAQITQRKWDAIPGYNHRLKSYLEKECIGWIKTYLSYGKETLLRTGTTKEQPPYPSPEGNSPRLVKEFKAAREEFPGTLTLLLSIFQIWSTAEPPVVTMSSRTEVEDGMEMHVCRLDGFYPREIDASWRRDGEVWLQDTLHGSVAPNSDGTHHYWLSIRIDPKERGRYRCHVEHDGLQEPLDMALKDAGSNLRLIIGCVVTVLILVCVIVGILVFLRSSRVIYQPPLPVGCKPP